VKLDDLTSRRVAVWGLGVEGTAMVALLRDRGVTPVLVDDRPGGDPDGRGGAPGGSDRSSDRVWRPSEAPWASVDVVVRAPGVSRYRPELAAAEAAGATVTTAMAVWLEDHADAPVIAVTGTKGKSTTAALAAAVLDACGRRVELIGNIGVPVVATYGRPRPDAYVVEVSSYQAADVTVSPGVVVLTSLAPDHLDWHGGMEPYYRDKLRLVEAGPSRELAVNAASPEAVRRTAGHPHRTLYGPQGRVSLGADGWVHVDGTRLVDAGLLRTPGRHNVWNLCGALSGIVLLTGAAPGGEATARAVSAFEGLPSRCRPIGTRGGRTFVDDALASNPFASAASVDTFAGRPLAIIVGGADRGVDPGPLVDALAARGGGTTVVVLQPDAGDLATVLAAAGLDPGSVRSASDVADAVRTASDAVAEGGVVLFSPGAPTPEGGGGYRERSRQFASAAGITPGPGD
jgi:UDP-N-acetylmuramoyl-L-alanine---L-glutamate ligase